MKFWQKLAQIFLGIFVGYCISQVMRLTVIFSGVLFLAHNFGGTGRNSFLYFLASWGLLFIGLIVALAVGIISNFLLIAFLPISGIISSCTSIAIVLWYIVPILTSFLLSLFY